MRPARSNLAFTLIVGAVLLVGAVTMALVLLASGAPRGIATGVVLAALPLAPLLGCYLWLDRYEPEPRSLLLLGLGWGAFVATSGALLLEAFDVLALRSGAATQSVLVAPLAEEAAKGLFIVLLLLFRRSEVDGILDGIVYAGMVGIGFAFTENILYLSNAYLGDSQHPGGIGSVVGLFVARGVFSPFAHPFFTAFTGIGVGIAVMSRGRWLRVLAPLAGFVVAVGAHALWNGSLVLDGGTGAAATYLVLMVPAFALVVLFALWVRRGEGVLLAAALTDCARLGLLEPGEVPWLTRLPARTACRRHARAVGGTAALAAMKGYQRAAVELGFLHHRYLRGTAPRDYRRLGDGYLRQMAALRPRLIWPGSTAQLPGLVVAR